MGGEGEWVWVRRSVYQGAVTSPKTAHSERPLDVPQPILDELAVYREMWPPKDPGYVFRTAAGKPLDPDNWYKRRFLPTLERAGLRRVGVHALRHTYASLLINQGESIKYVSRQLGHASIQMSAQRPIAHQRRWPTGARRPLVRPIAPKRRPVIDGRDRDLAATAPS
jgi:integrase